jgi:hypothetical protein
VSAPAFAFVFLLALWRVALWLLTFEMHCLLMRDEHAFICELSVAEEAEWLQLGFLALTAHREGGGRRRAELNERAHKQRPQNDAHT